MFMLCPNCAKFLHTIKKIRSHTYCSVWSSLRAKKSGRAPLQSVPKLLTGKCCTTCPSAQRSSPEGFSLPQRLSWAWEMDASKGKSLNPKCSELLMNTFRANSLALGKFSFDVDTVERISLFMYIQSLVCLFVYGWILLRHSALSPLAQG